MIRSIFLVGYRAVGKTTIGRTLAQGLGYQFVDTDQLICEQCNMSVKDIVAREGWLGFRHYEQLVLASIREKEWCVIATGGGAVLHHDEWEQISRHAFVVWLTAEPDLLRRRIEMQGGEESRPSLTGSASGDEVALVMRQREPYYKKYCSIKVDTGKLVASDAVQKIIDAYRIWYEGAE